MAISSETPGRKPRVLVVDDNRDFAENIAEVVQDLGFPCVACFTGKGALEAFQEAPFDIAVIDLQLPDMFGTRLITGFKERNPRCVSIVFTGNATLGNAIEALNRGAFAYLVKGGEVDEFRAIFSKAVESFRNLAELDYLRGMNRTILDNFAGRMAVLDEDDRVLITNEHPIPSLPGPGGSVPPGREQRIEDLFPPGRAWCREVLNEYRRRRQSREAWVLRRVKATGAEEAQFHLNIHFVPLQGSAARWLVFVDDVSKVVILEGQMEKSARLAVVGEMAAVIAHEVRNPLSGISGAVQLLRPRFPAASTEREACDQVIAQVDRLDKTIEDLLVLARPMSPKLADVSLSDLVDSTVEFLRDDSRFSGVDLRVKGAGKNGSGLVDPFLFRQALLNVLINAAQAMGGKGQVEVVLESGPEWMEVRVRDHGPGFPPDHSRLFEAFYTTKPAGTGLGLPITAKIMEVHGGAIYLRNHEGGAEVVLRLPRPAESPLGQSGLETARGPNRPQQSPPRGPASGG